MVSLCFVEFENYGLALGSTSDGSQLVGGVLWFEFTRLKVCPHVLRDIVTLERTASSTALLNYDEIGSCHSSPSNEQNQ